MIKSKLTLKKSLLFITTVFMYVFFIVCRVLAAEPVTDQLFLVTKGLSPIETRKQNMYKTPQGLLHLT